jgi:hypothetical protein
MCSKLLQDWDGSVLFCIAMRIELCISFIHGCIDVWIHITHVSVQKLGNGYCSRGIEEPRA